jgi:small subunit ribosomal protein S16
MHDAFKACLTLPPASGFVALFPLQDSFRIKTDMAVKIRLQRVGATNQPKYRMVIAEDSTKRDGRFVEIIGSYDPTSKVEGKQLTVNLERAAYWQGVGAQPSDTARTLINRAKRETAGREVAAKA